MSVPLARARRPVLCLVTDRQRLAERAFSGSGEVDALLNQIAAAVREGVELIQIRERDLSTRVLVRLVSRAVDLARGSASRIVVNDRLDVALGCGASGVHLRGDSVSAAAVRPLAPASFLVGRSVHGEEEAIAAAGAGGLDYLIAGTVFPTSSKPGRPTLGVEGLARIVRRVSLPVLAIGGITSENIEEVRRSGAAGVAAVGWFAPPRSTADGEVAMRAAVNAARRVFDTSHIL